MLRWTIFCACLFGLTATEGLAVDPALSPAYTASRTSDTLMPPTELPDPHRTRQMLVPTLPAPVAVTFDAGSPACEPDVGLPRTESDFLTQQRWTRMPAFEIFDEPLPPPMSLAHPPVRLAPCPLEPTTSPQGKPRYAYERARPAAAATVTVSDDRAATDLPNLTMPVPLADPAAMVVQLFQKLKASEERVADAERRLAEAEHELNSLRTSAAGTAGENARSSDAVLLEIRCFDIALDELGEAEVALEGICKEELSRVGIAALVAGGAFDEPCTCTETTSVADGPAGAEGCKNCSGCSSYPVAKVAEGPGPLGDRKTSCSSSHGRFIEDTQAFEALLGQLEEAGVLRSISRPRLMTRSGETARIMVGQQFAMKAAIGDRASDGLKFRTAGTDIEARPIVKTDGTVQIELHAQWSTIDEEAAQKHGQPVFDERSIGTSLEMPAGTTAVVAGLMRHERTKAAAACQSCGVPVPGEDRVFSETSERACPPGRKEFVVVITPKVVAPLTQTAAAEEARR